MVNVSEIREQVAKLLAGDVSLDDFENWFVPYSWNIHKHGDSDAQRLVYAIEHQLSEFDEDCEGLRRALAGVLPFVECQSAENFYGDPSSLSTPESNAASAVNCAVAA